MRMFLVGMCDIFLVLYLTTLSQVNPFNNSYLTVDDYNKLKETKIQAEHDSEVSNKQILELKSRLSSLDKEKEHALQLILTAKTETEKVMQMVNTEKEKAAQTKIALSKTIGRNEELNKLVQKSQENEQNALKTVRKVQVESQKARENEQKALKAVEEIQIEVEKVRGSEQNALITAGKLRLEAETSRKNELNVLQIVKEIQVKVEKAEESEHVAIKTVEELRLKVEEAKKNEEEMRRLAEEARLKAEDASRNEEIARKIAKEERSKAEKALESEAVALKLADNAENLKMIALNNEAKAKKAEVNALKIASVAQSETAIVKSKIKSITQTSDKAYSENVLEKLTQFTITTNYGSRLNHVNRKVVTMQGLPVKMGDDHVIFVPLEQIGLGQFLIPEHYTLYNITANSRPVTRLYIKQGETEVAALVINSDGKHCLPVGKTHDFSSYMPVLFSIRCQKLSGVMDRIRGISSDFFIFKRDQLFMITTDEFYFENKGFRGTGNNAEYIVKGDQVVDLDGNFFGFAYKKNKVLRIDSLEEWHRFSINDISTQKP